MEKIIHIYNGNRIYSVSWKNEKGEYHNENGPAMENIDGEKIWCINGEIIRTNLIKGLMDSIKP